MIEVRHIERGAVFWYDGTPLATIEDQGDIIYVWHLRRMLSRAQWIDIHRMYYPYAKQLKYERDSINGRRYVTINLKVR